MRVLFTGGSSFTGFWFIKELNKSGHEITAIYRKEKGEYEGVRKERVNLAGQFANQIFKCEFGDERFLNLVKEGKWDLLCHHAALVTGYKNLDFDFVKALANNTREIIKIITSLKENGCSKILLTGSVFEANEGVGDNDLQAFSPYGLSKTMTFEAFRFFTYKFQVKLGKFVIPNPFGPFEEPRFTNYLIKTWYEGKIPTVRTPDYVRDNIHVTLLAKAYAKFAESLSPDPGLEKLAPSGYVETQGEFAQRFANEMNKRMEVDCRVNLGKQEEFNEPLVRYNDLPAKDYVDSWDEEKAWDEIAEYYKRLYANH